MMHEADRLLTIEEVADRLRCGLTSVYALMKKNQLPYVQILGMRRVEESALQEFIAAHRIGPRTSPRRWGRKEIAIR